MSDELNHYEVEFLLAVKEGDEYQYSPLVTSAVYSFLHEYGYVKGNLYDDIKLTAKGQEYLKCTKLVI